MSVDYHTTASDDETSSSRAAEPSVSRSATDTGSATESCSDRPKASHKHLKPGHVVVETPSSGSELDSTSSKSAKRRTKTHKQKLALRQCFRLCERPSKEEMDAIATKLGLTFNDVCRWFRNERFRTKNSRQPQARTPTSASYPLRGGNELAFTDAHRALLTLANVGRMADRTGLANGHAGAASWQPHGLLQHPSLGDRGAPRSMFNNYR